MPGKNFNIWHYTKTFQINVFRPAMLISTIDFYRVIPLSMTLTLTGDHKVGTKRNLLASFLALYSSDQAEMWCGVETVQVKHPDTNFE